MPLVASQMLGLILLRYMVKVEPIASMGVDQVVATYAPVLQRYLFDPLPGEDRLTNPVDAERSRVDNSSHDEKRGEGLRLSTSRAVATGSCAVSTSSWQPARSPASSAPPGVARPR